MPQSRINPALLGLAQHRVWRDVTEKQAFQPPGGDPAMMGGAPPMDPAMMGGAPPPGGPPMDPSMMGGAPPMDPAMMGGAPPMDPSMMGGAPPMDPAMMGGAPPADPAAAAMGGAGAAPPKLKPEQMMQMLDFRMYNMQQQMTALLNALNVQIPAGALVMPPGQMNPTPEAALPGGPQDPSQQAGPEGAPGGGGPMGQSEISPMEPFEGGGKAGHLAPRILGRPFDDTPPDSAAQALFNQSNTQSAGALAQMMSRLQQGPQ